MTDRRHFLGQSAAAMIGLALGRQGARYGVHYGVYWHNLAREGARTPAQRMRPVVAPEVLRALAKTALETAVGAGATFADIRIAERRLMSLGVRTGSYGIDLSYGVRACVNGQWAFAYGTTFTPAGVQAAARQAVAMARALQALGAGADVFLHPAPVVVGEWATPVQIDPFTVSFDDHDATLVALEDAVAPLPGAVSIDQSVEWVKETRVVATSEGTVVTQHLMTCRPQFVIHVHHPVEWWRSVSDVLPELAPTSAGFEVLLNPAVSAHLRQAAEEEASYLRYPAAVAEVGRYDAVYDGGTVAMLALETLAPALELDRVLGRTANDAGTSWLAPLERVLATPLFSPALHLNADRTLPHYGAARWDDEGVATAAFPLVVNGQVVDWFGTRRTVGAIAAAGHPTAALHGTAVAGLPTRAPVGMGTMLTVRPAPAGPSRETLLRDMGNGVLLLRAWPWMDHQRASGVIWPERLFKVKNGRITHWLRHGDIHFQTSKLWTNLVRAGGPETVATADMTAGVGQPFTLVHQVASAPAAMQFRNVDVIQSRT